jgi:hypothetical protein
MESTQTPEQCAPHIGRVHQPGPVHRGWDTDAWPGIAKQDVKV